MSINEVIAEQLSEMMKMMTTMATEQRSKITEQYEGYFSH